MRGVVPGEVVELGVSASVASVVVVVSIVVRRFAATTMTAIEARSSSSSTRGSRTVAFFPAATLTKARSSVPSGRVEKIRLRIHVCGLTEALAAASRTPTTRANDGRVPLGRGRRRGREPHDGPVALAVLARDGADDVGDVDGFGFAAEHSARSEAASRRSDGVGTRGRESARF